MPVQWFLQPAAAALTALACLALGVGLPVCAVAFVVPALAARVVGRALLVVLFVALVLFTPAAVRAGPPKPTTCPDGRCPLVKTMPATVRPAGLKVDVALTPPGGSCPCASPCKCRPLNRCGQCGPVRRLFGRRR